MLGVGGWGVQEQPPGVGWAPRCRVCVGGTAGTAEVTGGWGVSGDSWWHPQERGGPPKSRCVRDARVGGQCPPLSAATPALSQMSPPLDEDPAVTPHTPSHPSRGSGQGGGTADPQTGRVVPAAWVELSSVSAQANQQPRLCIFMSRMNYS